MKALVKHRPEPGIELQEVGAPALGPNDVRIAVRKTAICGTDMHIYNWDAWAQKTIPVPMTVGHEYCGTLVELGSEVTGFSVGDRVSGEGHITCGHCRYCVSGKFIFCSNRRGMGHGVNGGFARYVVMRPDQLYRVPKGLPLEEAAISEPFAAAIQAVTELTEVRIGDTALVSGPGPMGLLCLKLLVAEGVKTIVAGAPGDEARLDAARRFGAAAIVNVGTRNLLDAIRETDGLGVDVAFECAGHENSVRGCIEALRPMGNYTQVGICGQEIQFPMDQVFYKQLKLSGSVCYTAQTWDRMMKIYDQGRVRLNDVISNKLPISEWRTAFDLCTQRRALKVLMYPEL